MEVLLWHYLTTPDVQTESERGQSSSTALSPSLWVRRAVSVHAYTLVCVDCGLLVHNMSDHSALHANIESGRFQVHVTHVTLDGCLTPGSNN